MPIDKNEVLLFLKAPRPDRVKCRIAAALGTGAALELYRRFVLDELDMIDRSGLHCRICVHPPDAIPEVAAWLGYSRSYRPQVGADLGERMEEAFHGIFAEGTERAILIGSDLPDLPAALLRIALDVLEHRDAVIGPASDGGYYLIGFRRSGFAPDIFHSLTWSRQDVFDRTNAAFERSSISVHQLPVWQDADTIRDLRDLLERSRGSAFASSRTVGYLKTIGNRLSVTENAHGTV